MSTMQEIKCRNCTAPLVIETAVNGVVKCEYCNSRFTLPKPETDSAAVDAIRLGYHELDTCAFDRAYKAFGKAAQIAPDESEAYFGMALAEHKVQYLHDNVNNCLQPICHEISDELFRRNKNYQKALGLATQEQRAQYEKQCKEIDYIREEFYNIKQTGLDYDCFICVKVSGENGNTQDSYDALKIYNHLKERGYAPFYSEEEIHKRTGVDYEALILYALYSSECMLVVCRDESYLKTPWVENEYKRFLKLVNDEEKESDAITIVFGGKPIEHLPDKNGKIQGIDLSKPDAYTRITDYVERHTPAARSRRENELKQKAAEEEETRKLLEELRSARESTAKQATKICIGCGAENPANVKFCGECGGKEFAATVKEYTDVVRKRAEDEIRKKIEEEKGLAARQNARTPVRPKPVVVSTPKPQQSIDSKDFNITGGRLTKYKGKGGNVVIPDSVTSIGNEAFDNCSGLTSVIIPNNVKSIGNYAFNKCSGLTSITIPNSVTSIGKFAFGDCSGLTSIIIPNSVTSIGISAFGGCSGLTSIEVQSGNKKYHIKGNCLIETESKTLVCGCKNSVIPSDGSVTSIANDAFRFCSGLTSVEIPNSVTSIGHSAFWGCSGLTSIIIPNSVTSIGDSVFRDCKSLTSVTIPDSITRIVFREFLGCQSLTSVTMPKHLKKYIKDAFGDERKHIEFIFTK